MKKAGWDLPLTLPKLKLDCQYDGNPDALEGYASITSGVNFGSAGLAEQLRARW